MIRLTGLALALALLLACSEDVVPKLKVERALDAGSSFTAYLVSYRLSGLKLHAMVAVPRTTMPANGFPVIVANHGYVPDPTKYGITAEGVDSRPGDYYRAIPELYTSRGFLVVMPDYRGHNSSEGYELIKAQNREAVAAYADDVIALLQRLDAIERADLSNVFMWSHSMGGAVSMRAQLTTSLVKGASYWATTSLDDLAPRFGELEAPIMLQHSIGDTSTEVSNSQKLADALQAIAHPVTFHKYEGADHYFEDDMRELAADRDAAFFRELISSP